MAVRTYPTGKDNEAAEKRMLMEAGTRLLRHVATHARHLKHSTPFGTLWMLRAGKNEAARRCRGA